MVEIVAWPIGEYFLTLTEQGDIHKDPARAWQSGSKNAAFLHSSSPSVILHSEFDAHF